MSEKETFEEFRKSFFYGSRSDMNFKFMDHMDDEEASAFLQKLFHKIINSLDANDPHLLKETLLEGQVAGYLRQKNFDYDEGPFVPFAKDPAEATLTLLTSSGHFVKSDDPKPFGIEGMTQEEAEKRIFDSLKEKPILSDIPFSIEPEQLTVRHGGYDIRAAQRDGNVTFPWQRLKELQQEGVIGKLTDSAYSFVGACSQKRLIKQVLPEWVEKLKTTGADAALLVPV